MNAKDKLKEKARIHAGLPEGEKEKRWTDEEMEKFAYHVWEWANSKVIDDNRILSEVISDYLTKQEEK